MQISTSPESSVGLSVKTQRFDITPSHPYAFFVFAKPSLARLKLQKVRYPHLARAQRSCLRASHTSAFFVFIGRVAPQFKLQKVRYPLCPPDLNGLPSRASHTFAFFVFAKPSLARLKLQKVHTTAPNFAHYRSCGYFGSVWLKSPNSLNILRRNRKVKKPSSTLVFFTHGSRF